MAEDSEYVMGREESSFFPFVHVRIDLVSDYLHGKFAISPTREGSDGGFLYAELPPMFLPHSADSNQIFSGHRL